MVCARNFTASGLSDVSAVALAKAEASAEDSHKRLKGSPPRSEPCVASIDAAAAPSADPKAGELEPDSRHRRALLPRQFVAPRFGALPPIRSPHGSRGVYRRHSQSAPRPAPLAPFVAIPAAPRLACGPGLRRLDSNSLQ